MGEGVGAKRALGVALAVVVTGFLIAPATGAADTVTLVARGSTWRYLDNGSDQGTAWRNPGFADGSWSSGAAELGYGDGDEATVVKYGPDPNHRYRTTYFRRTFDVADASTVTALALDLRRDDGAVVYLNGTEVVRTNMPSGTIGYLTGASTWADDENAYGTWTVPTSALHSGTNTLAVEIHQDGWASSDISMDLGLRATLGAATTTTTTPPTTTTSTTTTTTTTTVPACRGLGAGVSLGRIGDTAVTESSGLALGVRSPGVLYTHNDSGDTARFFTMTTAGRALGRFSLTGVTARDWEDMAVGPGPVAGQSYLYLGDVGGPANPVAVYRVPEPSVSSTGATSTATTALSGAVRIDLTYGDGVARNVEAMLVDPVDGSVNLVTKTTTGTSEVFRFVPPANGGSVTPTRVRTITVPAGGNLEITAGSVSRDGSTIALRTYDRVLRWHRSSGTRVADALAGTPCVDTTAWQSQGEGVTFAADGKSLLFSTEGSGTSILSHSQL